VWEGNLKQEDSERGMELILELARPTSSEGSLDKKTTGVIMNYPKSKRVGAGWQEKRGETAFHLRRKRFLRKQKKKDELATNPSPSRKYGVKKRSDL